MARRQRSPSLFSFTVFAGVALASAASALTLSVVQIGGTAIGGTGRIGDSVIVAIEVAVAPGEVTTAVSPALQWDLGGGNVLDAVSASETGTQIVNGITLNPINGVYRHGDAAAGGDFFPDGSAFPARDGATFLWGFESVSLTFDENGLLEDINTNGLPGAATFRVGSAEFVLRDEGATTISFFEGPGPWATTLLGVRGEILPTGDAQLNPLDIASVSLQGLSLFVVPEPGTGVLVGLGLGLFGLRKRRGAHCSRTGAFPR